MKSSYLELVRRLKAEIGASGSITSVSTATEFDRKLVMWIADADMMIQALWPDWKFLWAEYEAFLQTGQSIIVRPTDINTWDTSSIWFDYNTDNYFQLKQVDYNVWRSTMRQGVKTPSRPSVFAVKPNYDLVVDPISDKEYLVSAEYWRSPVRLTANTDTSPIPEKHERVIISRAKMIYAEHDNAPEVLQGAMMEYRDILRKLEAEQVTGREALASNEPILIEVL